MCYLLARCSSPIQPDLADGSSPAVRMQEHRHTLPLTTTPSLKKKDEKKTLFMLFLVIFFLLFSTLISRAGNAKPSKKEEKKALHHVVPGDFFLLLRTLISRAGRAPCRVGHLASSLDPSHTAGFRSVTHVPAVQHRSSHTAITPSEPSPGKQEAPGSRYRGDQRKLTCWYRLYKT